MTKTQVAPDLCLDRTYDALELLPLVHGTPLPRLNVVHFSLLGMKLGKLVERIVQKECDIIHQSVDKYDKSGLMILGLCMELSLVIDIVPDGFEHLCKMVSDIKLVVELRVGAGRLCLDPERHDGWH